MKKSKWFLTLAAVALAVTFTAGARAADNDETTLTGTLVCGKCKLHETKECQNVLQVEKDGKTVNYYLAQNKVSKDFHSNVCMSDGEKVTVTGKVKEKGGKETVSPTKIEPAKS